MPHEARLIGKIISRCRALASFGVQERIFTLAVALVLTSAGLSATAQEMVSLNVIPRAPLAAPAYLAQSRDAAFGTPFVRVTEPGRLMVAGVHCDHLLCRHRYASAQAWNADQSLLLISKGCSGRCFLDGQTYQPAFHRRGGDECEWHPVDPSRMVCVGHRQIYAWQVREDRRETLYLAPEDRTLSFGPSKGNLSARGDRLVVRSTDSTGLTVAHAYDITSRRKYADIDLSTLDGRNSSCSIAPSGRYIFCNQTLVSKANTAYVFDVDGRILQHWTENHRPGHGDMIIDSDGEDVYVGVSKAPPDNLRVIKRRLVDGVVTALTEPGFAQQVSARAIKRPDWVFVTYSGSFNGVSERRGWAPFYQEVAAVRIDGSGVIRRIVQTRSARDNYASESHASVSPDGSQIIWASNWGALGGPVSAYVARLAWPAYQPAERAPRSDLFASQPK